MNRRPLFLQAPFDTPRQLYLLENDLLRFHIAALRETGVAFLGSLSVHDVCEANSQATRQRYPHF